MDKKALNLPILISLVAGVMIGTGIYILPASLAEYGTISIFAWVFTSIGAIFIALTFAHLNQRFPKTGGPYIFCREAYGRLFGFIVAYIYWMGMVISVAGLAVASIGYLGFLLPMLNANTASYNSYLSLVLEIAVVWLFTLINIIGIHAAGVVQLVLTIIKISPLIIITLFGISFINLENLSHLTIGHETDFSAISSAAALTFWAFIGLEAATVPAENTRGSKPIFKATIIGTLLVSTIYISSTFILMAMIPINELRGSQFPFSQAATILFGHHAAVLVMICAVLSGLGSMNGTILIQGQIVFAAARDHLFPRQFSKLSKHDVPVAAQLLSSSITTLLLITTIQPTMLKQFTQIALLSALLTLTTYLFTVLSEIKFVLIEKKSIQRKLINKSFIIAAIAAFYCLWMISNFEKKILIYGLTIIVVSIPIYFSLLTRRSN